VKRLKRKKKIYEDDDGRTIASMNVDGMPWHAAGASKSVSDAQEEPAAHEKLRGPERRAFTWGVLKAVLLVTAVFVVGYFLFILFCTNVWFA
jgi:hypothetical protein